MTSTDLTDANIDDVNHPMPGDISLPSRCFGCGEIVSGVAVWWNGTPGDAPSSADCLGILLHADCAQKLGVALIGDAIKASQIAALGPGAAGVNGVVPSLR